MRFLRFIFGEKKKLWFKYFLKNLEDFNREFWVSLKFLFDILWFVEGLINKKVALKLLWVLSNFFFIYGFLVCVESELVIS